MRKRILSLLLILVMIVGLLPTVALAKNDDFTVTISMEGLTLGQGYYLEPRTYTLDRINELVKGESWAKIFTADNLTADVVTIAMLNDAHREYTHTGTVLSDFYLSRVSGIPAYSAAANSIPQIILKKSGQTAEALTADPVQKEGWLGEQDYNSMSGWMFTARNSMPKVGCAKFKVQSGDVIRWQFSLYDYGADLGYDNNWGAGTVPYFTAANKDELCRKYAASTDETFRANAKQVLENLTATEADIAAALKGETPEISTKPTGITIDPPLKPSFAGTNAVIAINELEQFDPDKTEYHLQTTTKDYIWHGASTVTVHHADPDATVKLTSYPNADDLTIEKDRATAEGKVNTPIAIGTFNQQPNTGKLVVEVTSQGKTSTYNVFLHCGYPYPFNGSTYTWNGQTYTANCTIYSVKNQVTLAISPDVPDDAEITVVPNLPWKVMTSVDGQPWDGKVQLKDGKASLSVDTHTEGSGEYVTIMYIFAKDSDLTLKALTANKANILGNLNATPIIKCVLDGTQVYLAKDATKLELTAKPNSENAVVKITNGDVGEDGKATSTVKVSQGSSLSRTYTVNGYLKDGPADQLMELHLGLCNIKAKAYQPLTELQFDPDTAEYHLELDLKDKSNYVLTAQMIAGNADSKVVINSINRYSNGTYNMVTKSPKAGIMVLGINNLINLDYWAPVEFTVTSKNGTASKTYTVYIKDKNLAVSDDASLRAISYQPNGAAATDVAHFNAAKFEYTVTLPLGTTTVNLAPKVTHPGASVTGAGKITLADGTADVTMRVTAPDGETTRTYTVHFVSAADSDYLAGLSYQLGSAEAVAVPGFDKYVQTMIVELPADTADGTTLTLVGTQEAASSTLSTAPVTITNGRATASITVTNGEDTRTYTVYFRVGAYKYADNELAGLKIESPNLVDSELVSFVPDRTEYTVNFANTKVLDTSITATLPEGSEAEISIHYHHSDYNGQCVNAALTSGVAHKMTGQVDTQILDPGDYQIATVTVTPKTGGPKEYKLRLVSGDGSRVATGPNAFKLHNVGLTVYDKDTKEVKCSTRGSWNMFFTSSEKNESVGYGKAQTGDIVKVTAPVDMFLVHPVEETLYGTLIEGETTAIRIKFIDQAGIEGYATCNVHLNTEQESRATCSNIYYSVDDGTQIAIPLDSFSLQGTNDLGMKDMVTTITLPEDTYSEARVELTGIHSGTGSIYTEAGNLKDGMTSLDLILYASSANDGTTYRVGFRTAKASSSNALLSFVNYQIGNSAVTALPNFNPQKNVYQTVVKDIKEGDVVKLTAMPKASGATLTGDMTATVENGVASFQLTVTSEDGKNTNIYTFDFSDHFDTTTQKGLTELTYSIGSEATRRSVKGFSGLGSVFTVTVPYATADNETIHFYPTLAEDSDAVIDGSTDLTLENGQGTLTIQIRYPHGKPLTVTVNVKREGKIMSVYEYLPIGSQYTNNGFGNSPIVYNGTQKLIAPPNNWANCQTCGNFGGYMTYKLTNPLKNDPANPYGVDFIVYGNSQGGYGYAEPASIWVAQDKDNDGQPDKWYELAGSAHYDAETIWNYQVTYIKENDGSTAYETSKGESGVFPKYEYPDIDKYGSQGVVVDPVKMTLTGTLLDEKTREPLFGYGDAHANDDGNIETPMNPYRPGSDQDSFSDVHNRGDAMDISWAVDENGLPVELDEISFIKAVNASFVLHSAFGERSAEIYVIVPLYGNADKEAVGQSAELSGITLEDTKTGAQTASLPFKSGKYVYTFEASALADQTLKLNARDGANVIVNNAHYDEDAGYLLKNAIRIADDTTMLRIVVQEGEKEPTLYYLTIRDSSSARWTLRFDANGGLIDGEETLTHSYYSDQSGEKLPVPTRAGYTFLGWYDGETRYEALTDALASGTTLTAKWQENNDTPVPPVVPSKPSRPSKPSKPAEPDTGRKLPFTDVISGSWYYDGVKYAYDNGLMNGTSANEFNPNANTTRSMIVTILARMEGVNTSGGETWYARGREWSMGAGISDGTNMTGKITREQLAAMLYRYAKLKGYDVSASADISGYTDASSVSSWATDAMRWAVSAGLINGRTATTLAPQGNATRAEVASILMRFMQKYTK